MLTDEEIRDLNKNVHALKEMALNLYNKSDNFPAVNRNCKRILASVEMLMINLGASELD